MAAATRPLPSHACALCQSAFATHAQWAKHTSRDHAQPTGLSACLQDDCPPVARWRRLQRATAEKRAAPTLAYTAPDGTRYTAQHLPGLD